MKTIGILFGEYLKWDNYPFSKSRANKAYSLLSSIGVKKDIRFLISTFKQLEGNILKKAWVYDEVWQLVENREISIIFDRSETNFKNDEKKEEINKKIKIFNNPGLNKLCWDKMQTYDYFSELVPRTFAVDNINELKEVISMIGSDTVVLKPRYGVMGKDIQFLDKKKIKEVKKNFVAQQFIDSSAGINELGIEGVHDLRVVIINGSIDHSYIRSAEKGSLFANCIKGGKKIFLDKEKIPPKVLDIVKEVDSKFEKYDPRIYSIDFVYDQNGKIWISELESIPGFAYYDNAEKIRDKFLDKIVDVLNSIEPRTEEEIEEIEKMEEERRKEAEDKKILREAKQRKIEEDELRDEDQEDSEEKKQEEEISEENKEADEQGEVQEEQESEEENKEQ